MLTILNCCQETFSVISGVKCAGNLHCNYFQPMDVVDRIVNRAREKHLGETVIYGGCCVSFLHGKSLVKNTFFKSIPKKMLKW